MGRSKKKHHGLITITILLLLSTTLQFCSTSRTTTKPEPVAARVVSYTQDIQPIMAAKCAPCHFPETGKKKKLNTYLAVRDNYKEILVRVQLPADHEDFMPLKGKKEPLTAAEIQLLKDWGEGKMQD